MTLAIRNKFTACYKMYHCNTSPAAVTAHIDYETKMILFIVDSGAGNTEANKMYSALLAQSGETGETFCTDFK